MDPPVDETSQPLDRPVAPSYYALVFGGETPVAQLKDQLQDALGVGYRLERELGGAGMSHVFLAEEVALGRRVVVKVLPPEMAIGVNAERFRREIQLAASLQHPHIVPLLSAGASQDLVYYVMPFVEGESLRTRLAREGELPVAEVVRILRDVVDALSYAHEHQVVHRDIKPDNVLLSGNHAVVTDFGVAKAVTDAAAADTLTAVGVAMGTPLYMAPEQAAADPHTDQRADIYAVGVLGYEMLCGRPPFTGRTAQTVVAAHIAETPDPVTRHRPAVPTALDALIMRCLEKKAADRWQRAEELMPALEGMLTPSGGVPAAGSAKPGGVSSTTVSASGAGRRSRLRVPGLVALGLVGMAGAAYVGMRLLGVGSGGTLLSSGELAPRSVLVVSDFRNRTSDSTLAASITEAFRIDLSQSPAVKLMDATTVAAALRRMDRDPRSRLDEAAARDVAQREGAKAVVAGDVGRLGSGYVLTARLISAADGSELVALRETADDSKGIIAAVDRLSQGMRRRIGESLDAIQAAKPLDQVTTRSLDALRLYTEGSRAADLGDLARGTQLLQQAIALDTTFAMAYRKLSVALTNSQASNVLTLAAMRNAYRFRARLPLRERYLATAFYEPDLDGSADAYRTVLETYPDDWTAANNLAGVYCDERRYAEAEAAAKRAIAVVPTNAEAYWNLARALVAQARVSAADSAVSKMHRAISNRLLLPWVDAMAQGVHGDFARAQAALDSSRDAAGPDPTWRANFSYWMAGAAAIRGRLAEAAGYRQDAIRADEERGKPGAGLREAVAVATVDLRLKSAPEEAARRLDAALAATPLRSIPAVDRPYVELATLYAQAGRADVARRLVSQYVNEVDAWSRGHIARERMEFGSLFADSVAMAEIALGHGHEDEAIARLRRYLDGAHCELCGLFEAGEAYDRAQQPDSAAEYYERLVTTPSWWRIRAWSTIPVAYERLCDIYGKKDDRAKARRYCGDLVKLWKDADPELQPAVRAARKELVALGSP